jgi:uncharacterized membrane protein
MKTAYINLYVALARFFATTVLAIFIDIVCDKQNVIQALPLYGFISLISVLSYITLVGQWTNTLSASSTKLMSSLLHLALSIFLVKCAIDEYHATDRVFFEGLQVSDNIFYVPLSFSAITGFFQSIFYHMIEEKWGNAEGSKA